MNILIVDDLLEDEAKKEPESTKYRFWLIQNIILVCSDVFFTHLESFLNWWMVALTSQASLFIFGRLVPVHCVFRGHHSWVQRLLRAILQAGWLG